MFRLACGNRAVTLVLREGFVTEEFLDLARKENRSGDEESKLVRMKLEMAERVMAHPADEVYDATEG